MPGTEIPAADRPPIRPTRSRRRAPSPGAIRPLSDTLSKRNGSPAMTGNVSAPPFGLDASTFSERSVSAPPNTPEAAI